MAQASKKVQYASRLRTKVKNGRELTAEEKAWLDKYESVERRAGRKSSPPPLDDEESETAEAPSEASNQDVNHGAPKEPPPINMGTGESNAAENPGTEAHASGADRGTADHPRAEGANRDASTPSAGAASGAGSGQAAPDAPPTPEQLEQYKAACLAICKWMNNTHREMESEGLPAIPEQAIMLIVGPNMFMTAVMFHKYIQRMSKIGAPVISGGAVAMTLAGTARMRRMRKTGQSRVKPQPKVVVDAKEVKTEPEPPKEKPRTPEPSREYDDLKIV